MIPLCIYNEYDELNTRAFQTSPDLFRANGDTAIRSNGNAKEGNIYWNFFHCNSVSVAYVLKRKILERIKFENTN